MTEYGEELLRQRVWHWLETEKGMAVDAEVDIGTGRIDLIAKASDGQVLGIEVKTRNYSAEQANRYAQSEYIDRLYLASGYEPTPDDDLTSLSGSTDFIDCVTFDGRFLSQTRKRLAAGILEGKYTHEEVVDRIDSEVPDTCLNQSWSSGTVGSYVKPRSSPYEEHHGSKSSISLEEGVRRIKRHCEFPELGIIRIPPADIETAIKPGEAPDPAIVREPDSLIREREPEFARQEEPWIRHALWQHYSGIPEGHIPNVMDSDQAYRPIDLISFEGSTDPSDVVQNPQENKILGFEAKGKGSYSPNRLQKQLSQYLETECFSQLYVAVPDSLVSQVHDVISDEPTFSEIGIVAVSTNGEVTVSREGEEMKPKYDGYIENFKERKTGYGEQELEDGKDVETPYVTDEEAIRLRYTDPASYALDLLSDNVVQVREEAYILPDSDEEILLQITPQDLINEDRLGRSVSRAYVVPGEVIMATPTSPEWDEGLVEFLIQYHPDEDILRLNFGKNNGGYIWLNTEGINHLQTVLHSLVSVAGGIVQGHGFVMTEDIPRLRFNNGEPNRPTKASVWKAGGHEKQVHLRIESKIQDVEQMDASDPVAVFQLDGESVGVDIEFTKGQWFDLIASIDILRTGSGDSRELPRRKPEDWGHARIAPSGNLVTDEEDLDYSKVIRD